nr:immunoglobulin heavy chain junction region [Macaca mulatta]MOX59182.1 immunoglobulin heavy chain junction region [Macaca mulatta]MOX59350.1 immunoglobulin heavy chain junction region [Macaca mulatta]MOX59706.1 immunoglobulin heavy chain junction region [Macaca mulatta]MOX59775.1 immunoglobulin heavy chain junction region [Macaca mulatta]
CAKGPGVIINYFDYW